MAALETGRTSWKAVLDAVRLEPVADVAAVTTAQIREVVEQLIAAGQCKPLRLEAEATVACAHSFTQASTTNPRFRAPCPATGRELADQTAPAPATVRHLTLSSTT